MKRHELLISVPSASQKVRSPRSRGSLDCIVCRRGAVNPQLSQFAPMCTFILPTYSPRPPRNYIIAAFDSYSIRATHIIHPSTHQHQLSGQYTPPNSPVPYKKPRTAPSSPSSKTHRYHFSTQLNSTQLTSTQKAHDVHSPHLPLATLPPPTLHRHRHLRIR